MKAFFFFLNYHFMPTITLGHSFCVLQMRKLRVLKSKGSSGYVASLHPPSALLECPLGELSQLVWKTAEWKEQTFIIDPLLKTYFYREAKKNPHFFSSKACLSLRPLQHPFPEGDPWAPPGCTGHSYLPAPLPLSLCQPFGS